MRVPASRAQTELRLAWFDVAWAIAAPVLSLLVRDLDTDATALTGAQAVYCLVSSIAALCFFWSFRIRDAIPSYFCVDDAVDIIKAGIFAAAAGTATTFALTRLEGIPRSTPFLYALILVAGLLVARAVALTYFSGGRARTKPAARDPEQIVVIGADHATSLFIKLLRSCGTADARVVAVLDERRRLTGRAIAQVRIVGSPSDLDSIVDEFQVHGVAIDRVIVNGGHIDARLQETVAAVCKRRRIQFDTLSNLASHYLLSVKETEHAPTERPAEAVLRNGYAGWKRLIDLTIGLTLLVALAPIMLAVSLLIWIDVGSPVLFWQRRVGMGGRKFLLYKFRTLRAPFDRHGVRLSDAERLSFVGATLRALHFDELPQLFNVIVGDMSIVGPRPLLPIDQPTGPTTRLMVRPGITGWAQLNGGKFISATEKGILDDWYVKNTSLALDAKILTMTGLRVIRGGSGENWVGDAASTPGERLN